MFKSIRWRLPLSYAAIALLVALSLGAVLLVTLRGYYTQLEREHLTSNAQAISTTVAHLLEVELPPEVLQPQLDVYAFLSQAKIRVLDADEKLIAASTSPETLNVSSAAMPVPDAFLAGESLEVLPAYQGMIVVEAGIGPDVITMTEDALSPIMSAGDVAAIQTGPILFEEMFVASTPFGFGLGSEAALDGPRSDQVERQPFYDDQGELLGYVELSDGPAYGREIVNSVARGWALAGGIAVALAAVAGWLISRRMTVPLVALTSVTASMAGGDLSARAQVHREDEIGTLARSFNLMADRVEGTVVTLRRFVTDAAHELHTPLTALRTSLELARHDEALAPQSLQAMDEHLVVAQVQAERLQALTDGLLDLSRLEAVPGAQDLVPIALAPLIRTLSEPYASRAEQAGVHFELSLPETPIVVPGDEAQLNRALSNLLDNAIKFTPEGGGVNLGLRREADSAVVWVEDTGIGIPEDDLAQLFKRFHRGRNVAGYPGSGLGLAIVKAIVEGHGGRVEAEPTAHGTQFNVIVPIAGPEGEPVSDEL